MPWHADSWLAAFHPWEGGYWSAEPREQFNPRVRGQSGVIYRLGAFPPHLWLQYSQKDTDRRMRANGISSGIQKFKDLHSFLMTLETHFKERKKNKTQNKQNKPKQKQTVKSNLHCMRERKLLLAFPT